MKSLHLCIALCSFAVACGDSPQRRPAQADTDAPDDELEFDIDDGGLPPEVPEAIADAAPTVASNMAVAQARIDGERLELAKQQAEIAAARQELDARLERIDGLQKRIEELKGEGETARKRRTQRIGGLASLIITMPPQPAAEIVAAMPDADAQALLHAMMQSNERKASKLLSSMSGERAAELGRLYLARDPDALTNSATTAKPTAPPPTTDDAQPPEDES